MLITWTTDLMDLVGGCSVEATGDGGADMEQYDGAPMADACGEVERLAVEECGDSAARS